MIGPVAILIILSSIIYFFRPKQVSFAPVKDTEHIGEYIFYMVNLNNTERPLHLAGKGIGKFSVDRSRKTLIFYVDNRPIFVRFAFERIMQHNLEERFTFEDGSIATCNWERKHFVLFIPLVDDGSQGHQYELIDFNLF